MLFGFGGLQKPCSWAEVEMGRLDLVKVGLIIMILWIPLINIVHFLIPDFELMLLYPIAVCGYGMCMIGITKL